jgi:ABC-2 type transport system permease protein
MNEFLAAYTLWRREVVRFLRQPNRVFGAVGSPVLFWLILGSGVGRSFSVPGAAAGAENSHYLVYAFPGSLVLILLFTAIFSTISIIEDRKEGFLQSVLVAPVPRRAVVLGKILGGTTLAFMQAAIFLALGATIGMSLSAGALVGTLAMLWLLGMALTGLGFVIAWRMQSIQGFHAIMNFLLIPLWLLSGALFPPSGASVWMQWLIRLNPLTYGTAVVRRLLFPGDPALAGLPGMTSGVIVSLAFAFAMYAASAWVARGTTRGDLH